MKKVLILSLVVGLVLPLENAVAAEPISRHAEVSETNVVKRKRKARGYRKKKGFLWGLFRKNDCGCPKH